MRVRNLRATLRVKDCSCITRRSRGFFLEENKVPADTPVNDDGSEVPDPEHQQLFCGALLS